MAEEDYYALLSVGRNATEDEIKKAYLRLARELHPDRHAGNSAEAEAKEERFKLVNRAYETLKDPERRRQYDMFGAEGERVGDPFGGFAGGGLGDIFDAFFGGGPFGGRGPTRRAGPPRGENVEGVLEVSFAEAVLGTQKDVTIRAATTCETCAGSGARPGTTPVTCTTCNGAGELRRVRQSLLGQMVTSSPCPRCGGTGEEIASPCSDCRGQGRKIEEHSYTVDVPAGVDDGSTLRLTGRGAAGPRGGPPGDLYLHLRGTARPDAHPGRVRLADCPPGDHEPGRSRRVAQGRDAGRPRGDCRCPGVPEWAGGALARPRRTSLAETGPGRPAGHDRGRDADRIDTGPGGAVATVRRRTRGRRGTAGGRVVLAHSQRLQVRKKDAPRGGAPFRR